MVCLHETPCCTGLDTAALRGEGGGEPFHPQQGSTHPELLPQHTQMVGWSAGSTKTAFVEEHYTAKFTDEQYATINQSTAGRFDPRVFVNCLQVVLHIAHQ